MSDNRIPKTKVKDETTKRGKAAADPKREELLFRLQKLTVMLLG